jgi:RNA polymerase sigma factor (sigma-70 family)
MAIPAPGRGASGGRSRWSRSGSRRDATGGAAAQPTATADPDDQAIAELYRQYWSPLMAFVLRLNAGDRQQAEDIVQETMLRAWRQGQRLDHSTGSLMPWLATVARRIVIDEQRKKEARPTEAGDDKLERASVTDLTDDVLRSVIVTDALRALSTSHREVLNATILSDRTVNEAAEVLGIPVGTVKSRVYYALRALRLVLAERGVTL